MTSSAHMTFRPVGLGDAHHRGRVVSGVSARSRCWSDLLPVMISFCAVLMAFGLGLLTGAILDPSFDLPTRATELDSKEGGR